MRQHIIGTDMSDALTLLQQLAESGASGTLKTYDGALRLARGRVVQHTGSMLTDLIAGQRSNWGWRKVAGIPNGSLNSDLSILLLQANN